MIESVKTKAEPIQSQEQPLDNQNLFPAEQAAMAVRRQSSNIEKNLHLIYNEEYGSDPLYQVHLSDLRRPFEYLGYLVKEYFVTPENIKKAVSNIPVHDNKSDAAKDVVFMHIDMPIGVAVGTQLKTAKFLEQKFKWQVCGHSSEYSAVCVWKSTMNAAFSAGNVTHVESVHIHSQDELIQSEIVSKLKHPPYFIKIDAGFNSLGLSNDSVCYSDNKMMSQAAQMLSEYGPIIIQNFIGGREFTVAVDSHRAYHPVERHFEKNQLCSLRGGTCAESLVDAKEVELIQTIKNNAFAAYQSVGGTAYGRVDLRQCPETGEIYVLEVNNTCSLFPDSYFEQSVEAVGGSVVKILKQILVDADLI